MSGPLIVQKYGGSSLATPEQIQDVAEQIAALHRAGHRLLIVVSAMGKTTDELVALAYRVSPAPNRRELDMLLTTGERISMALMSMALGDRDCHSISFTGSQAGVLTDELHSNARIIDIRPTRVESELDHGHVVVLAGFQGVSPVTKEITTLGRGGSDTTAVAMAAYFKAERCEIRKDVDGVYSADPRSVPHARHLTELSYEALLDMTYWGAKVLHYRSVELAAHLKIPLVVALAHKTDGNPRSTLIHAGENSKMNAAYEKASVLSVNSHQDARWITVQKSTFAEALALLSQRIKENGLPLPQLLDGEARGKSSAFLVTAPRETLHAFATTMASSSDVKMEPTELATVTVTCQGAFASMLAQELAQSLEKASIPVSKMIFGAMSITFVVAAQERERAIQALHAL